MEICRKQKENKTEYNTSYGVVVVSDFGDDYVYFHGETHLVRDLCIRHKFVKVLSLPNNTQTTEISNEKEDQKVEDAKPTTRRRRS